jgi:phosphoserine phosphatase
MPFKETSETPPPLYVDLDGTLIATDTLIESLRVLARQRPWMLVFLPFYILGGRANFKKRLAGLTRIDPTRLPYRRDVLDYLREEKNRGRTVVLATAAYRSIAEPVASHLGLFDDVIATDGSNNLKGAAKLDAIRRHCGNREFVYAGDSMADLPILRAASGGILVHPSRKLRETAAKSCNIEKVFD